MSRSRNARFFAACLAVLALGSLAAACSDDGSAASGSEGSQTVLSGNGSCGPVITDALDPASGRHVLPGAPEPLYKINPPTSGAHQPGLVDPGVRDQPLAKAVQVGVLEGGDVIIHYNGLAPGAVAVLAPIASGSTDVVLMPDPTLGSVPIVVTSWVHHMDCSAPDATAIGQFVTQLAGRGPGHAG